MKEHLPLFPLNMVAFPGEIVNLHIFEERYKQLINECLEENKPFGIPAYVNSSLEYGTEVLIEKLVKRFDNGEMDISTRANRVFYISRFENPMQDKLYAGGKVSFLDNIYDDTSQTKEEMKELIIKLYETVEMVKTAEVSDEVNAFSIGHKVGLSVEEEYQLLQLQKESERQHFIVKHLKKVIPILQEVERTKERIRMNGHFKYLDPLDF